MKRTVLPCKHLEHGRMVFIEYDRTPLDQLRQVARERYAWPGGYELMAIMDDGALICSGCTIANYRDMLDSTRHGHTDGWRCVGATADCNFDSDYCAHCGRVVGVGSYSDEDEEPSE